MLHPLSLASFGLPSAGSHYTLAYLFGFISSSTLGIEKARKPSLRALKIPENALKKAVFRLIFYWYFSVS